MKTYIVGTSPTCQNVLQLFSTITVFSLQSQNLFSRVKTSQQSKLLNSRNTYHLILNIHNIILQSQNIAWVTSC